MYSLLLSTQLKKKKRKLIFLCEIKYILCKICTYYFTEKIVLVEKHVWLLLRVKQRSLTSLHPTEQEMICHIYCENSPVSRQIARKIPTVSRVMLSDLETKRVKMFQECCHLIFLVGKNEHTHTHTHFISTVTFLVSRTGPNEGVSEA